MQGAVTAQRTLSSRSNTRDDVFSNLIMRGGEELVQLKPDLLSGTEHLLGSIDEEQL